MLIRISLIVAIVAGLATAAINFVKVKEKIETVKTERDDWHGRYDTTYKELTDTKDTLDKTSRDLKKTQNELASTTEERDRAVNEAETQTKRATQLNDELNKTRVDRDEARTELAAWDALGITVDRVKDVIALAKNLQELAEVQKLEITELIRANGRLSNQVAHLIGGQEYVVYLPAKLRGTVLVSDPKWDFVVVDVGEDQGVLEYGELLVNRGGKLIAKVVVRNVQKGRSIANVVPGWKLEDVLEGDQVIPAHPST